jgi:hypothetical protein
VSSFFKDPLAKLLKDGQNWLKTEDQETWLTNQKKIDFRELPEPSVMPGSYLWRIMSGILTQSSSKGLNSLFVLGLRLLIVLIYNSPESGSLLYSF